MNEHYKFVLEDAQKRIEQLELEYTELSSKLDDKEYEIEQAKDSITFIKEKLLPYSEEAKPLDDETSEDETNAQQRIPAIKRLEEMQELAKTQNFNRQNESGFALGNATELILQAKGNALHADILLEELTKLGRYPEKGNYTSTLRKDSKERFFNLGGNVWDLRIRHQQETEEVEEV